jgi:hypothetical protein
MAKVVNSGFDPVSGYHLFDDLDRKTIDKIARKLAPQCRGRDPFMVLNLRKFRIENPLYGMVKGMKPWLAFVGAPHVRGVSRLLHEDGFNIEGPNIPEENNIRS